jgi:cell division protein FtsW
MFRSMGESTYVRQGERSKPAAQHKSLHLGVDAPLILVVIMLLTFGLVMVYSASYDYSLLTYGSGAHMFQRQVLWALLGLGAATFLTFFDYHFFRRLAVPAIIFTVGALIAVLILNQVRLGAVRTFVAGSVQPSELAKLVMIIYLSVWLFSKREQLADINFGMFPLAAILGLLGGLIFLQPDLSATITIVFLGGMMFFLAGAELRQIVLLVIVSLVIGFLVVKVNLTGSERMTSFQAGISDPMNASYHVRRSLEAFVKGGWLGVGIGKSETKLTGLPFPSTDSIFAVVGEETGVVGSLALVGLYVVLFWRGLTIARRAPDMLGTLLAAGLSVLMAFEAFVNMSVMLNLLPFAGNALPFLSSGGSNLLISLSAIGILLNISRQSVRVKDEEGRSFSAVVDLRRRDRRGRVSRPVSPASHDKEG